MRDSRVMVPGSTTFWMNVFTDTPQLTGCCPQGVLNQTARVADYGIMTDLTAENRAFENSLLWFKALGVRAVAVSGPRSTEVYTNSKAACPCFGAMGTMRSTKCPGGITRWRTPWNRAIWSRARLRTASIPIH